MSTRRISWLDVFTDRPFTGNQLAVILDGDGLTDDEMQSIAAEVTISETTFLQDGFRRLRTFTPTYELPLAGHPTVGSAFELARRELIPAEGRWVFQTGIGETPVDLTAGTATMTQAHPRLGDEVDATAVAAALGIGAAALSGTPQFCTTTGIDQLFAQVVDRTTLATLGADGKLIDELPGEGVVAWCEVDEGEVAQRFFAPGMGTLEDAATGSAAGALGALRVFRGAEPGPLLVRQGEELGRGAEIHVEVGGHSRTPRDVRVGGSAVLVFEGELSI